LRRHAPDDRGARGPLSPRAPNRPGSRERPATFKNTGGDGMEAVVGMVMLGAVIALVGIAAGKREKAGGRGAGFPASRRGRWRD